jgi:hypothetical protein
VCKITWITILWRMKRERVNRRCYQTRSEARADIFDGSERIHIPRKRQLMERERQNELLLNQLSVVTGVKSFWPNSTFDGLK